MTSQNDDFETQRFQKLRDAMSADDIQALRARFKQNPNSLSADEVGVLYVVTRKRIRAFETKARRKKDREKNSHGSGSAE
jgi:DNA-directed RNA polymerase sigma subunit (sigma70/sigma32)